MSLDLTVVKKDRFSDKLMDSIHYFLLNNGFREDRNTPFSGVYRSNIDGIYLNVYVDPSPEEHGWWDDMDSLLNFLRFYPKAEIDLESRHTKESHIKNYSLALQLADLIDGIIYDNQEGVFYNSNGEPYAGYKEGDKFSEYGGGIKLLMEAAGIMKDLLEFDEN